TSGQPPENGIYRSYTGSRDDARLGQEPSGRDSAARLPQDDGRTRFTSRSRRIHLGPGEPGSPELRRFHDQASATVRCHGGCPFRSLLMPAVTSATAARAATISFGHRGVAAGVSGPSLIARRRRDPARIAAGPGPAGPTAAHPGNAGTFDSCNLLIPTTY